MLISNMTTNVNHLHMEYHTFKLMQLFTESIVRITDEMAEKYLYTLVLLELK